MKDINTQKLPIRIEEIGEQMEIYLRIGDLPGAIIEPKEALYDAGFVYIVTTDFERAVWEDLLPGALSGCSNDPRLLKIASQLFDLPLPLGVPDVCPELKELTVGIIFGPNMLPK